MSIVTSVQDVYKQLSPADLTIIAGLVATGLQYLLNRYRDFAKIVNWLLATVFPFVSVVALALLGDKEVVKMYPWAFLTAQAVYQVIEWLKRNAVAKTIAQV